MRIHFLQCILISAFSLAGCTKKAANEPNAANPGRRILITPPSEPIQFYMDASTVSADQSMWVAANYGTTSKSLLLTHLDTLGKPLAGRVLAMPFISSLAALSDGGTLVLRANDDIQPALARLKADGTTIWSKQIVVPQLGSTSLFPGKVVALGDDALIFGVIGNKEFAFSRVSADGTAQPYIGYQLPAQYVGTTSRSATFTALPGNKGAALVYQTGENSFVLATLSADGKLVWMRQLTLTDLAPTPNPAQVSLAVAPTSGNLMVGVALSGAGAGSELQVLRISASGSLLSTFNYSVSDNSAPLVGRLAMDAQEQISWMAESLSGLYYYAVDAQGNPQVAKKIAPAPTFTTNITLTAYGVVYKTIRGAYALGTSAGPSPANAIRTSLNFLAINTNGQAGCQQDDAPALTRTPVSGTQFTVLPIPAANTRTTVVTDYPLPSASLSLTASSVCQ